MTPRSGRTQPGSSRLGPDYGSVYHSMPTMSPDVNSASEISQRYNVIVYSLYAVGVGRAARSSWDYKLAFLAARSSPMKPAATAFLSALQLWSASNPIWIACRKCSTTSTT